VRRGVIVLVPVVWLLTTLSAAALVLSSEERYAYVALTRWRTRWPRCVRDFPTCERIIKRNNRMVPGSPLVALKLASATGSIRDCQAVRQVCGPHDPTT